MIVYLFGAAAAWWVYQKYMFTQKAKFDIADVAISGSFYNPFVILTILITNPSNISTEISNINAELFLNDSLKVGNIFYSENVTIGANSQTPVSLNIYPNIDNVIKGLQEVISTKNGVFNLKGHANVDGITIPFNLKFSMF